MAQSTPTRVSTTDSIYRRIAGYKEGVMWMFDFDIFYRAGQDLLLGNSPYGDMFWSPLPLAVLFVPFAVFPKSIAYALYLALSLWLLWKVVGRKLPTTLLFFPVLFTLFVGQVDLLLTLSAVLLGPYTLPLLLAKPQLGFVLFPWLLWNSKPKHVVAASLLALTLLAICFFIRPNWVAEWLAVIPSVASYSARDSNLYWFVSPRIGDLLTWIVSPLALVAGALLRERRDSWVVLHLLVPISNVYSAATLVEWVGPIEVALSWAAVVLTGGYLHGGAPMWVVGLPIAIRGILANRRSDGEQKGHAAYTRVRIRLHRRATRR